MYKIEKETFFQLILQDQLNPENKTKQRHFRKITD